MTGAALSVIPVNRRRSPRNQSRGGNSVDEQYNESAHQCERVSPSTK
jgi:hypothetical protein